MQRISDREKVITTEVDFMQVGDNPQAEVNVALAYWAKYGLRGEVTNPSGPGGGAAVVQLTGPTHAVEGALRKVWDTDAYDLYVMHGIETNDNSAFVHKVTTEKLQAMLQEYSSDGWAKITPHFVGGRDWVVTLQR